MKSNGGYRNCPLCSQAAGAYWPLIGIFRCPDCELLFRDIPSDKKLLDSLYSHSWESPLNHVNETGSTSLILARQYVTSLCKSLSIKNFDGLKILDYGAGFGLMAKALSEFGAEVVAVEPFGYRYIANLGIQVYRALDDIPQEKEVFDGVVSLEVVEHLQEPLENLKTINSLLKPGGWLYISTPNSQSLNARLRRDHWREALKVSHIALYNQKSLSKLLLLAGFKVKRLRWWIKYQDSIVIRIKDYLLQRFLLDGDLKLLAFLDR